MTFNDCALVCVHDAWQNLDIIRVGGFQPLSSISRTNSLKNDE